MRSAPGRYYREGVTLVDLIDMFPDEDSAREWFEARVWPDGRIWTPPRFASNLFEGVRHDCARISGLLSRHTLMPGHDGLSARQLPIAFTDSRSSAIRGFG